MANNRMFLVHRPSGLSAYLGKRTATGWYDVPRNAAELIQKLFTKVEANHFDCDDFCIGMEDNEDAPMAVKISNITP